MIEGIIVQNQLVSIEQSVRHQFKFFKKEKGIIVCFDYNNNSPKATVCNLLPVTGRKSSNK